MVKVVDSATLTTSVALLMEAGLEVLCERNGVDVGVSFSGELKEGWSFSRGLAGNPSYPGTETSRLGEGVASSTLQQTRLYAKIRLFRTDSSAAFSGSDWMPTLDQSWAERPRSTHERVEKRLLTLAE